MWMCGPVTAAKYCPPCAKQHSRQACQVSIDSIDGIHACQDSIDSIDGIDGINWYGMAATSQGIDRVIMARHLY